MAQQGGMSMRARAVGFRGEATWGCGEETGTKKGEDLFCFWRSLFRPEKQVQKCVRTFFLFYFSDNSFSARKTRIKISEDQFKIQNH